MRYELFISLRYLRAKRRERFISLITLFSTLGVLLGVMVLDIVLSVMTGFEEDLRDRILGFNPHVILSSLGGGIHDYGQVVDRARGVPGVAAAAPVIYGQVMVSSRQSVSGVLVRAVDPGQAGAVIDLTKHIKQGALADLGAEKDVTIRDSEGERTVRLSGVIVGGELAKALSVAPGDPVNLVSPLSSTPGPMGMVPKVRRFFIAGTFDSGMYEYDSALVYMALGDAQQFFGLGDTVTGVEIRVEDVYEAPAVAARVEQLLGVPYRARPWTEINRAIFQALKLEKFVYFIVLLLILLVAAFNIIATLIMVVMEKRKDIAVLKSLGATTRSVARVFIYKGLIIGVGGTVLGTVLGYVVCVLLKEYEFIRLPPEAFYTPTVPVKIYWQNFFTVGASSLLICLLATIYPARQAANLTPVEVLRYE